MRSEHAITGGVSDGGKTTLWREGHHVFEGVSIWVNHKDGDVSSFTERLAGVEAKGRQGCHDAAGQYERWEDVRIDLRIPDVFDGLRLACAYARDLWDTAGVPTQIIVDEAHHVLPKGSGGPEENPANWALAEGRDKGIKLVLITQNPQMMDKTELLNARYWVWVGEYAQSQRGWLDYYGFDREQLPDDRFEYSVFNREMDLIDTGETNERYA